MDFARELDHIESFLTNAGFQSAVIGGVALAAYGNPRLTLDLDLLTHADAQDAVVNFMTSRGFETLHQSAGYTNHLHPDRRRVDFMYVRGSTAEQLFAGLHRVAGPGGNMISVPKPEHLIAMKVVAMKDAPERTWQDLVDIGYLVRLEGVDRDQIRQYFEQHQLLERWHELERAL